jgi:hypothetical protein
MSANGFEREPQAELSWDRLVGQPDLVQLLSRQRPAMAGWRRRTPVMRHRGDQGIERGQSRFTGSSLGHVADQPRFDEFADLDQVVDRADPVARAGPDPESERGGQRFSNACPTKVP